MARVFISGVAGFLGSHLADRMLELGHEVVGCDNLLGGSATHHGPLHQVPSLVPSNAQDLGGAFDVFNFVAAAAVGGESAFPTPTAQGGEWEFEE